MVWIIGSLLAALLHPVAWFFGGAIAVIARSRIHAAVALVVAFGLGFAMQLPALRRSQQTFAPDLSFASHAAFLAGAMLIWFAIVLLIRRLVRGRWWSEA